MPSILPESPDGLADASAPAGASDRFPTQVFDALHVDGPLDWFAFFETSQFRGVFHREIHRHRAHPVANRLMANLGDAVVAVNADESPWSGYSLTGSLK